MSAHPLDPLSANDRGLPVWTAHDRPIEDTDVVLWYVYNVAPAH